MKSYKTMATCGLFMKITKILYFFVFILCSLFFYFFVSKFQWSVIPELSIVSLFLIFVLTVADTFCHVSLIRLQAKILHYRSSFFKTYLVLTSSLTANYITPVKIGIPIRIFLYKEILKIKSDDGISMVLVEMFLGLLIPALISIAGLPMFFPGYGVIPVFIFIFFLLSLVIILCKIDEKAFLFTNKIFSLKILQRILDLLFRSRSSLKKFGFFNLFEIGTFDIFLLFLQAVRLQIVLSLFSIDLSFFETLTALVASVTLGNISLIPMGAGVRDVSFVLLLKQVGVPAETAIACAAVQRLFSPGWPLLLGLISSNYLCLSDLLKKKQKKVP